RDLDYAVRIVAGEIGGNNVPHDGLRLGRRRSRRNKQCAADLAQAFSWNFRHPFSSLKGASDGGSFVVRTALAHPRLSLPAGKKLVSALEKLQGSPKLIVHQRYKSKFAESLAAE